MVLNNVSLIFPEPEFAALLIPATAALVQVKLVPARELVGVYENKELLHIVPGASELVNTGEGFIVIVNVRAGPVQPFAEAVTLTVAVIGVVPEFAAKNAGISPVPLTSNPTSIVLVQS